MLIKAKRIDLLNMLGKLPTLNNLKGFKIAYAIKKNKIAIEDEARLLDGLTKTSPGFLKYDAERVKICLKYAEKDESGEPIIVDGTYKGIGDNPKFTEEVNAFMEANKELIDAEKKKTADYNSALQEEIEFNMRMIGIEDVPEDITVIQMDTIYLMVRDHDGKIEKKLPEVPPLKKP